MEGAERLVLQRESFDIAVSLSTMTALSRSRSGTESSELSDLRWLFELRQDASLQPPFEMENLVRRVIVMSRLFNMRVVILCAGEPFRSPLD